MKRMTTTSYALLGLLALRSWTTYELAQQMERSLRNFWPGAQSKLYEEPKNLVAHGFATASRQHTGRRPRTVYSITPAGREAMRAWLDEPGEPISIHFDALLRVFFADQGTREQLENQLKVIEDYARLDAERGSEFTREYMETGGPFPERLHIIGLVVGLLARIDDAITDWANWARKEVSSWDDVEHGAGIDVLKRAVGRDDSNVAEDRVD